MQILLIHQIKPKEVELKEQEPKIEEGVLETQAWVMGILTMISKIDPALNVEKKTFLNLMITKKIYIR